MRACLFCGSFANRGEILCPSCKLHLANRVNNERTSTLGLSTYSLWNWQKDRDYFLSQLLNYLKYHEVKSDWDWLADQVGQSWLLFTRGEKFISASVPVFIHAPTSTAGQANHAKAFAKALARYFGSQSFAVLEWRGRHLPQKKKRRRDRGLLNMSLIQTVPEFEKYSEATAGKNPRFIFVDDIITTGSTARAAYIALGRPEFFEVWTLARRLPSSGP